MRWKSRLFFLLGGAGAGACVVGNPPGQRAAPTYGADTDAERQEAPPVPVEPPVVSARGAETVYSMAMHMHGSISEGNANMAWHAAQAVTHNVDVLWWTDHDVFYYPEGSPNAAGYDFESGGSTTTIPSWPSTDTVDVVWRATTEATPLQVPSLRVLPEAAHGGTYGARFAGRASDEGVDERATWYLHVSPRLHFKSLMTELTLGFWVRPVTTSVDGELRVIVPISGSRAGENYPADEDHKSIVFYHGSAAHPAVSDDGETLWVPIAGSDHHWTEISANLTDLAVAAWGEAARDLHAEMISVALVGSTGAMLRYDLDDLAWDMGITGQDLVQAQADYLATLGVPPRHLLGLEVSPLPEGHINIYGSGVPLLPYSTSDTWDAASMADWAHGYGGIASYNHMFGVSTERDDAKTRVDKVNDAIDEIVANRMWNLDLIEVGYRQRGGVIRDFLEVWDAMGMAGVYKTGIGAFDLHDQIGYDRFDNNFVTYVPLGRFSEANLITELKRGNAWFGDPTFFSGAHVRLSVNTSSPPAQAGDVVIGLTGDVVVTFRADELPDFSEVRLVENGIVTQTWNIGAGGPQTLSSTIHPVGGNVVRFEVQTASGNAMAYTNPIYFVDRYSADIPEDRRVFAPEWLRAHRGAAVR